MLDKLKLNKNLWDQYDELFKLTNKQKEMHNKFKSTCKERKINKYFKIQIKNIIYAPTTLEDFKEAEENFSTIENSIPKYYSKKSKSSGTADEHALYLFFLEIIEKQFNIEKEQRHLIKKQRFPEINIYDLLSVTKNITNKIDKATLGELRSGLLNPMNKPKVEILMKLLLLCDVDISAEDIKEIGMFAIYNQEDEKRIELLNTILSKPNYIKNKIFETKIKKFANVIMYNFDDYDYNVLKEVIDLLFNDNYRIKHINEDEIDFLLNILKKSYNLNKKNKDVILEFIDEYYFHYMEDKKIRKTILETLADIDIIAEQKSWLYKKYLIELVAKCKNDIIKDYLLKKLKDIKSPKSLKLIVDIYTSIISHINIEDTIKVIDNIVDFEKLESTKKKELIIPIKDDK